MALPQISHRWNTIAIDLLTINNFRWDFDLFVRAPIRYAPSLGLADWKLSSRTDKVSAFEFIIFDSLLLHEVLQILDCDVQEKSSSEAQRTEKLARQTLFPLLNCR